MVSQAFLEIAEAINKNKTKWQSFYLNRDGYVWVGPGMTYCTDGMAAVIWRDAPDADAPVGRYSVAKAGKQYALIPAPVSEAVVCKERFDEYVAGGVVKKLLDAETQPIGFYNPDPKSDIAHYGSAQFDLNLAIALRMMAFQLSAASGQATSPMVYTLLNWAFDMLGIMCKYSGRISTEVATEGFLVARQPALIPGFTLILSLSRRRNHPGVEALIRAVTIHPEGLTTAPADATLNEEK